MDAESTISSAEHPELQKLPSLSLVLATIDSFACIANCHHAALMISSFSIQSPCGDTGDVVIAVFYAENQQLSKAPTIRSE